MLASTCQYFLEKQKTAIWYFLSLWEKTGVIFTKVLNLFHLRGIYHRGYFLLLFCEFRSLLRKSRSVKKGQDHLFCLQYIFLSYTLATSSHLLVGMFTIVMMLRCLLPSKCLNINVTLNATKSEQKETKNAIQLSCCGRLVCFSSPFLKNSALSRCVFKNEQNSVQENKFPWNNQLLLIFKHKYLQYFPRERSLQFQRSFLTFLWRKLKQCPIR